MKKQIAKNTFFSGITNFSDFLQFALTLFAARMLEPTGFGIFCDAFALSMVFLTFSDIGLNHLSIRDIARDRSLAPRYIGNVLSWKVVLSLLVFGLLVLTSAVIRRDEPLLRGVVVVMGLSMMFRFFSLTGRCFMQGFERFDVESVAVLIEQTLLVALGITTLALGYSVVYFAFAFLLTRCVGVVVTYFSLRRIVPVSLRFEPGFLLKKQIEAAPIGVVFGILMAYTHMDTLILASIATHEEVGMYNSAFKVYNGLFMIPSVICTVLLPRLSHVYDAGKDDFRRLILIGVGALLAVSLPISALGFFFSDRLIVLLFREHYLDATVSMTILLAALTVSFQVWLLRTMFIASNRQVPLMLFYMAALAIRVAANLALIPGRGINGAATATLIAESFLLAGMWTYVSVSRIRAIPSRSPG